MRDWNATIAATNRKFARRTASYGTPNKILIVKENGAGEAIRTPDPNLGKVVLYP